jgi:hypothetical protein
MLHNTTDGDDEVKMCKPTTGVKGAFWINLAPLKAPLYTLMNLRIPYEGRQFPDQLRNYQFLRRTLLVGVNKFRRVTHTIHLLYLKIYKTNYLLLKLLCIFRSVWKDCRPIKTTLAINWLHTKALQWHFMHDAGGAKRVIKKYDKTKSTIIKTDRWLIHNGYYTLRLLITITRHKQGAHQTRRHTMPSVPDSANRVLTKPEITQRYTSNTISVLLLDTRWNVTAHGDAFQGKWSGNWRMEWVPSTLHNA